MHVEEYLGLFENLRLVGGNDLSRNYYAIEKGTERQVSIIVFYKNLPQTSCLSIQPPDFDYPGLVTVYDITEDDLFIVVPEEIVGPCDLLEYLLPAHVLSEKKVSVIANCIMRSLQFLHRNGIVNRNIKFNNIMVTNNPEFPFRMKDFMLAKLFDARESLDGCISETFPAPEIINGQEYGPPADIWSFGVMMYILLCGKHPYSIDLYKTKAAIDEGYEVDFSTGAWQYISNDAKYIVSAMLSVDPENRPTADEILEMPWINGNCPDSDIVAATEEMQNTLIGIRLRRAIGAAKSAAIFRHFVKPNESDEI